MKKLLLALALFAFSAPSAYAFGLHDLAVHSSKKIDVVIAQNDEHLNIGERDADVADVITNDLYAYRDGLFDGRYDVAPLYTVYHFTGDTLESIEHTNNRPAEDN